MASDPREPLYELGDEELYARWHSDAAPSARSSAWEALYNKHQRNLIAYCSSITHDLATAEDCSEEAFVRLLVKPLGVAHSFRAYLWKTARTIALDARDQHDREPPNPGITLAAPDPVQACSAAELDRAVESCLAGMNPHEREFLLLRACYDLSLEDARNIVGWTCAISTCKSRYDKTLQSLRGCLKKRGFCPEKTDLQTV